MGAVPRALLVSLSAPASLPGSWPADLRAGLVAECDRAGAVLVGGDVSAAGQIVVTGTGLGVLPDGAAPVLRSGARPGDVVALAGTTGASAAGLAILLAGPDPEPGWERVLALHRRPQPPYPAGPAAARAGATAMIDVSDGLLRDAERIAAASAVRVDLDPAALPPEPDVADVAARLGADPMAWVLAGGEDHALLATFPPGTAPPEPFRPVGRVLPAADPADPADPAVPAVLVGGTPWHGSSGWRHFEG
jgi:thiamine-monophosphate kinase